MLILDKKLDDASLSITILSTFLSTPSPKVDPKKLLFPAEPYSNLEDLQLGNYNSSHWCCNIASLLFRVLHGQ